jgi:hypothetical protein
MIEISQRAADQLLYDKASIITKIVLKVDLTQETIRNVSSHIGELVYENYINKSR